MKRSSQGAEEVPETGPLLATDRASGALVGAFIGDALAMPVHWYYDRLALHRDYGEVRDFAAPLGPHPGSILWRSHWTAPSPELDILGDQRPFWGQREVHYHQNLKAGENTLTMKLAAQAWQMMTATGAYDPTIYLQRYIDMMCQPAGHRDTYVEECHREFFTNLGRGLPADRCAVREEHIGGLVAMLPVAIYYAAKSGSSDADAESDAESDNLASSLALKHLSLTHAGDKMRLAAEAILSLLLPVIRGASLQESIRDEVESQRNPHFGFPFFKWLDEADERVIGRHFSTACYVAEAVPAVIYLALKYARQPEQGLIANTNLGGDNVHRGAVLGALLGAENGAGGWPNRWLDGLTSPPDLQALSSSG